MRIPGFRSNPSSPQAGASLLDRYRGTAVAVISDAMNRLHGSHSLQPFQREGLLLGTAVTVKTRPGDNLAVHAAFDVLRPGDVLVVDGGGYVGQALAGEIMMNRARAMGVAGFVIDGAIRDVAAFRAASFPCLARGVTHWGPFKSGPGELNVPVSIDGMVVMPGDIVIGDEDGIVAFDQAVAEDLLALVGEREAREAKALAGIAAGRLDIGFLTKASPDQGA